MDTPTFLFHLAGSLDTTADDLAQVLADLGEVIDVIEGSREWSILGQARHRLDVHTKSLRSLAARARRAAEGDTRPGGRIDR